MREDDHQLGWPFRAYRDTKAAIVALAGLGAGDEGCTAYATDTNEFGTYDGAAWSWGALPAVAAAGYALVSDGANSWAVDQTPLWTGEHSFEAGIAFVGASGANEITVPDNTAIALELLDAGGLEYMRIVSTNANPYVLIDPAGTGIKVGIGTAAPAEEVDITATTDPTLRIYGASGTPQIVLEQTAAGLASASMYFLGGTAGGHSYFAFRNNAKFHIGVAAAAGGAVTTRVTVLADGRVGVMTQTPHANFQMQVTGTTTWEGGIAAGGDAVNVVLGELAGVATIGGHNAALTAWADLVINSGGGNVGIGTVTPPSLCSVYGDLALMDGMTAPGTSAGWAKIYVDAADGDLKVKFGDGFVAVIAADS